MRHIEYHSLATQCGIGIAWVGEPDLPEVELIDSASAMDSDGADICARCRMLITVHYCADNHGAREYHPDMTEREKSNRIDAIKGFHDGLRGLARGTAVNRDNAYGIGGVTPRGFGAVDGRRWAEAYICGRRIPAKGSSKTCGYIAEFVSDYHHDCSDNACEVEICDIASRRTAHSGMRGYGSDIRRADDFECVYESRRD